MFALRWDGQPATLGEFRRRSQPAAWALLPCCTLDGAFERAHQYSAGAQESGVDPAIVAAGETAVIHPKLTPE
jgi:hypothetical protein